MNTLIKPPCTNEGRTPNSAANAYLASLIAGTRKSATNTTVFTVIQPAKVGFISKLSAAKNIDCIRNNISGKCYNFGTIYTTCAKLNNGIKLTAEEWDGFIEDFLSSAHTITQNVALIEAIRIITEYTREDIESELLSCIESNEDFNEDAWNNIELRNKAVDDLYTLWKSNRFVRINIESLNIARTYDLLK